jgi:aminoglycoside phosphotransferase (APT) family kinase protein
MIHHGRPPAEVEIDEELVRALLRRQHADLAELPLQAAGSGWDNAIYRLGPTLAVRLPRRAVAAILVEHEQRWLPGLGSVLPIPTPVPVRIGLPDDSYPWRWSILPWLSGITADRCEPPATEARRFGEFLAALHRPAPDDAPRNPFRGVPLRDRVDRVLERMVPVRAETGLLTADVERLWERALQAADDAEPTWIHGDLHPGNLLVDAGALSGVIDWGDLAAGDRATDLAAIWMAFADREARAEAMRCCGPVSEATWARARGWAVFFGVMLCASGIAGDEAHGRMGARTLERLIAGP